MPLLSKPELVRLAVQISAEFNLDPALVCSHVDVRSRWDSGRAVPVATSYLVNHNFPDPLECEHRSIQWGLMAISGEFARAEGYQGDLAQLLQPTCNLREGCRLIRKLMEPRPDDLVAASVDSEVHWNRANDRELAAQVLRKLEAYRGMLARMPAEQHTFQRDDTILPQVRLQIEGNSLV